MGLLNQASTLGTPGPSGMVPPTPTESETPGPMEAPNDMESPEEDMDDADLSPEDAKTLKHAMSQATLLAYDKDTFPNVLKTIEAGVKANSKVPFDGVSNVVSTIMFKVRGDAQANKVDISDDIMLRLGKDLTGDLITTAMQAKILPEDFPQGYIDGAFVRAVDQFRMKEQQGGTLDVGKHKQALQAMLLADKNGTLLKDLGMNRGQRRSAVSNARRV